jgi:hypothetical protein
LRALAVVRDGEGLPGVGPSAGQTAEAWDTPALLRGEVTVSSETVPGFTPGVLRAVSPRAEGRLKARSVLDGRQRPVHASDRSKSVPSKMSGNRGNTRRTTSAGGRPQLAMSVGGRHSLRGTLG